MKWAENYFLVKKHPLVLSFQSHRRIEIFACPVCPTSGLEGKENLKLHMYKSHGVGEIYRCEVCNFETSSKAVFTKHEATAHPEELQPGCSSQEGSPGVPNKKPPGLFCQVCSKAFRSRSGLKQHMQVNHEPALLLQRMLVEIRRNFEFR